MRKRMKKKFAAICISLAITLTGCNLTEYLTKGHSNVRPSVKRWEMTGNPVKSRVVANFIEKK